MSIGEKTRNNEIRLGLTVHQGGRVGIYKRLCSRQAYELEDNAETLETELKAELVVTLPRSPIKCRPVHLLNVMNIIDEARNRSNTPRTLSQHLLDS